MSKNIIDRSFIFLLILPILLAVVSTTKAQLPAVTPTVETAPVPTSRDAADDPAIWVHPTDPSLSLIFGTDKRGGGLAVYDLSGKQLQFVSNKVEPNNVDVRYNFPLGGDSVDIVAFSNEFTDGIGVFKIDPATRTIENIAANGDLETDIKPYGFCLYYSPITGKYYAIATTQQGIAKQYELFDNGKGRVDMKVVRTIKIGDHSEGCVADDIFATLYIGEEDFAIWKYGAEPGDGETRVRVYPVDDKILEDDIEGLTIYYASDSTGYLIASSQGNSQFAIFERTGGNAHLLNFEIAGNSTIDEVSGTDGIDVINFPLGSAFPFGVFIVQDDKNPGDNQNFKMVPWDSIANKATPPLKIDTRWDPRQVGVPSVAPRINFFSPTSGEPGEQVTIAGDGFLGTTKVDFNGTPATVFSVDSRFQIRAQIPFGARSGPIRISGLAGTNASPDSFTVQLPKPPAAPSNLTATVGDSGRIDLSWIDGSINEDVFLIERHEGDGSFAEIAQMGANVAAFADSGLSSGKTYTYRVRAANTGGTSAYSNEASATLETPTGIADPGAPRNAPPQVFRMHQNYPNPFNPSTTIAFDLPKPENVTLTVFNLTGEKIATLLDGEVMPAGTQKFTFNAAGLPSGIFFYQIRAGEYRAVGRMIYLR
ncbi:MAG: phytase [bacterium]